MSASIAGAGVRHRVAAEERRRDAFIGLLSASRKIAFAPAQQG
ncbi:MAG: hypothetical protein WDN08_01345 [Rhizomicrobium sp.]